MENKVIIVAGMHRSGTSVISQWLVKCGLHLGDQFLGPGIGNAEGHFEDLDFLNFHKEILRNKQLPESGLTEQQVSGLSPIEKNKLVEIIKNKNETNVQWGWKDPRTCLFLPVYRELLPEAFYLIIVRDVESTVSSLIERTFKKADTKERGFVDRFIWKTIRRKLRRKKLYNQFTEQYIKVWIAYTEKILMHISKMPKNTYKVIDYNLLRRNDRSVFLFFKNNLQISLDYKDFNKIYNGRFMNKPDNISGFVKNKEVLNRAKKLENKLRSFM